MTQFETRLTALAHGGGCGCKLSPAVLRELLADMPAMQAFSRAAGRGRDRR
jgi:selenide,water dikinase